MNATGEKMIAKILWKSEDGFQFIGSAQGHDWDVVSMTSKAVAQMDVGCYVWCQKKNNEEWGIYLEEIPFEPFATEGDWKEQEGKRS